MSKKQFKLLCALFLFVFVACNSDDNEQPSTSKPVLKLSFAHLMNAENLVFNKMYTNASNEPFTVKTLRYYVGEVNLTKTGGQTWTQPSGSYALIDASKQEKLNWSLAQVPDGEYTQLSFLLGVDSLYNVSGAQEGALDPLNGMFWTWNSGYIFLKLEGVSDSIKTDRKSYEIHIGGFKKPYNAIRRITLDLTGKPLRINGQAANLSEVKIKTDVARLLNGEPNVMSVKSNSDISMPSVAATKVADNYAQMFSVQEVVNP